ncbi:hypothetical protein LTR37_013463 [Vermiconidia calcicola]|uniref:Uncharacterized protein n=1 Tax=Vermiconidia calcicola TaxID=1690605 RepID=A0ACC3MWE6_9PEZI|nr:hypothetical protein LTR37_013463 [Vermiconidia calcicola]
MFNSSSVYVAGVGITHLDEASSHSALHDAVISAGTKALLDAGLTYSDVKQNVACFLGPDLRVRRSSFDTFGRTGTPTCEVDCYSGFYVAKQFVRSGHADCTMMVGFDKGSSGQRRAESRVAAAAIILVSHGFRISHAYLRDSAVIVRGCRTAGAIHSRSSNADDETITAKFAIQAALQQAALSPEDIQIIELRHGSDQGIQAALGELNVTEDGTASPVSHPFVGVTGLAGLLWQLRGWTQDRSVPGAKNCLQFTMDPDGDAYVTVLCRADGEPAPSWDTIKYLRDGRERLAHNPAVESKEVSVEDWQAVKARDNFIPEQVPQRLRLPVKGGDRAALARL